MGERSSRGARVVGLALWAGAAVMAAVALAAYLGALPVAGETRTVLAAVLGSVAVVDLLIGFWFFRSSLSS